MPSYVIPDKCDGCKALDKTACQYICPNDLMVLNKGSMKAFIRTRQLKFAAMPISYRLEPLLHQ
jgi:adenylylsulfate reductase subunit B